MHYIQRLELNNGLIYLLSPRVNFDKNVHNNSKILHPLFLENSLFHQGKFFQKHFQYFRFLEFFHLGQKRSLLQDYLIEYPLKFQTFYSENGLLDLLEKRTDSEILYPIIHLKSEDIEVKTIDYLINDFKTASIDLLKIDVEGYEIEVLTGAYKSLAEKKINFIYVETGLDDRFNSIQSLIDFLKPTGYLPYAFYEQTAHWTDRQSLWYWNTFFVLE